MYEFTKDCMLNIEQLDNEHRRLFQMVNEAVSLIDTVDDVSTISTGLINNLKDYAATHFAHEEASALKDIAHMPARVKCAVLGWRTLKEAIEQQA